MKKLLLVLPLVLSGCGFTMVRKDDAQKAVDSVYASIDSAKTQACSPAADLELDRAKALLDAFIANYLK